MRTTERFFAKLVRPLVILSGAFALHSLLGMSAAHAMVTQPVTGEVMPQPVGAAESGLVTSRGFTADADTLAGLFKYHTITDAAGNVVAGGDEMLDPIMDAHITPGTFSPQCGLSGTIVLHGGGCKNALGWYNADVPPKATPAQIYPLVPANLMAAPPNGIMCMDGDFCPLATRVTTQIGQHTWADPLPDFAGNIRGSPNWKGGPVGFALIGTGTQCPQTKFTQAELNDKSPSGDPWVTTLIYQSIADPNAYYIAFEDLPTCPASWRGCTGNTANKAGTGNDGDFNDFVFYVSGLNCSLGGKPCQVDGQTGICANGVTECTQGGTATTCKQVVTPTKEVCDGVDNDCNGMVDEGDLCSSAGPGWVCDHGRCVGPCNNTEFPCQQGYACANGLCVEKSCMSNTCKADQVCIHGVCTGGCDNVTCPYGSDGERQACRLGQCVDACAGITCGKDTVCEGGACQPPCGACRDCLDGHSCVMSGPNMGTCVKTGCENMTCPAGQVCASGSCVDPCDGASCPGGQACMDGKCVPVAIDPNMEPPGTGAAGNGGGGSSSTGAAGADTGPSTGAGGGGTQPLGSAGDTGSGSGGTSGGDSGGKATVSTCKCDTTEGPGAAGLSLLLVAGAIAASRRRRDNAAAARARTARSRHRR